MHHNIGGLWLGLMVFNDTFNNISTDLSLVTDKLYQFIFVSSQIYI